MTGAFPVYLVAAFADAPFGGNPAGVCLFETSPCETDMQSIASELRQPETAFLWPSGEGWAIRWFSPQVEVELCGHATLAAAHVLWSEGRAPADKPLAFEAASARLEARLGDDAQVWLDFPALPGQAASPPPALLAAVGGRPTGAFRHADRWVLEFATAAEVRKLRPDFPRLKETGARSLIATALSDLPAYDIVSRNFAPIVGVDEDQVTGMAHTCLAPHWADRLGPRLSCHQASARGGGLTTELRGDRVGLGGRAIIELAGHWRAPPSGL